MPSKNDEDKVKVDTLLPKINAQPPPGTQLPKPTTQEVAYELYEDPSVEDDMPWSEERFFLTEEYFFAKQLNHKFVERGYKRPVVTIRAETRRQYKNFRVTKREDKRQQERFAQQYIPNPVEEKSISAGAVIITNGRVKEDPQATTATTTANAAISRQDPNPAGAAANKYLSVNQEREYQDALRQTSNPILPAAGISLQQIMEMLNRDLTPEDYELLLRLDETVEKKTVAQETLTTLTEKNIDSEDLLSEVCTVCMFNYEMGDPVKYLPCKHFFHVDCIVPYLSNYGQACPVCKAKV